MPKDISTNEKQNRYILPWLGLINNDLCKGLDVNYGLYTQCPNNPLKNGFCNYCLYAHKQSGTVEDRLLCKNKLYKDKLNNKEVNYLKVAKNLNINISEANKYCMEKWSINLPDKYLNPKKRGRPKKKKNIPIVSDTDSDTNNSDIKPAVKKRGRPKKEKKKIITNGENLITMNKKDDKEKYILNNIISILKSDMNLMHNTMNNLLKDQMPCNEQLIEVKIVMIEGKKYYIDIDDNCYDPSTETLIGLYDKINNTIL